MWTENFQMFKLDLGKAEESKIKLPTYVGSIIEKAREFQQSIYFCFIDYAKSSDCVDQSKLWKIFQEIGIPASWEICMQVKEQQLESDMEQRTSPKLGKEYVKAVYCQPVCLTSMQSTSCKMLGGWITSWSQDCWEK